jgi:hypothetical protein
MKIMMRAEECLNTQDKGRATTTKDVKIRIKYYCSTRSSQYFTYYVKYWVLVRASILLHWVNSVHTFPYTSYMTPSINFIL